MGLFEGIRSRTNSVPAQIFFAVIVLVFVFWGVNGGGGGRRTTYAKVNGERVNNAEVQLIARQQQSRGTQNDDEQKVIMHQIIEQVILSKTMNQKTIAEGFGTSEKELALHIANDQMFKENKEFSQERYVEQIQNMGFASEVKYETRLAEFIKNDKHLALITHSAFVSDEVLKSMHISLNTTKKVKWVRISEGAFFSDAAIPEEQRKEILEKESVTLNEIYMANLNTKYSRPDTWKYQTVQIDSGWAIAGLEAPDTELLTTLQKSLASENIDSLMQKPPFQGYIKKGETLSGSETQIDPNIMTQLQSLTPGSAAISEDKQSLYVLIEKVPAFEKSFDDVKDELATEFAQQKLAATAAEEFAKKLHAAWTTDIPQEILDEKSLAVEDSFPFTAETADMALSTLGTAGTMIEDVKKSMTVGTLPIPYSIPEGWVVARLDSIENPTPESFKKQRSSLEQRVKINLLKKYTQELNNTAQIERLYSQQQQ